MSGGSYDYMECHLENLAEKIENGGYAGPPVVDALTPTRKLVGAFLRKAARLVHEIEWADSGDISKEDAEVEVKKILAEPPFNGPGPMPEVS